MVKVRIYRGACLMVLLQIALVSAAKGFHYSFISEWVVEAPVKQVWDVIEKGEDWHLWWKSIIRTEVLQPPLQAADDSGETIRYTWRALLPFTLTIDFRIIHSDKYKRIEGLSTGDLAGTGVWTFHEINGKTYIRYQWEVESTKRIINWLSPFLNRFFVYNHNFIMHRGAKGLAKKLGVRLLKG